MARWRALAAGVDPAVARFVSELRRVKDACGRTIPELARETGYSASSWERYLSGRVLPPREAVEALAGAAGTDPLRLLALHELARESRRGSAPGARSGEAAASGPAGSGPSGPAGSGPSGPAGSGADPDRRPGDATEAAEADAAAGAGTAADPASEVPHRGRPSRPVLRSLLTALAGAAVGAAVTALILGPGSGAGTGHPVAAVAQRVIYTCTYTRRDGLWYAGNSTTSSDQLVVDRTGPEVAELQCLLQRVGISPGGVDGSFGPLTEAAVIRAQKKFGLDVDGQVGPRTWAALRR